MKRVLFCCAFCIAEIVLVLCLRVPSVIAEGEGLHVSGDIAADTAWTATSSSYVLDSDIRILPGTVFTIGDGVTITGRGAIRADRAKVSIGAARFEGGPTLATQDSEVTMSSTTIFAGNGDAIHIEGGRLYARRLRLERNSGAGLYVEDSMRGQGTAGIYDSVFKENGSAIINYDQIPVEAQNDWWGQDAGPKFSGRNGVVGKVNFSPWLMQEPDKVCCSSVLFIPGLEGTRLYSGSRQVWEPSSNADVRTLFLDEAGKSVNSISVGEVIGKAYGLRSVYSKFLSFLDSLVAEGSVAEARVYGYDWRKPVDEVGGAGIQDIVESMASRSKTGKVSIVAHSNGGLVAKSLVERLAQEGRAALIDRVVSVAVPYVGTPEALLDVLHGDHQEILGGLILSAATAKSLAANMPSAYTLLPSAAYATATPLVSGLVSVSGHAGLWDFLRSRTNQLLLAAAEAVHAAIDPFMWPPGVLHIAVAGWNVLTTSGIHYFNVPDCKLWLLNRVCRVAEAHVADASPSGDGTVQFSSAAYGAGQIASLDLDALSRKEGIDIEHSNILESQTAQTVIRHVILDNPLGTLSADGFLLAGEPDATTSYVRFSVTGEADLKVFNAQNRTVGIVRQFRGTDATSTAAYVPATAGAHYSVVVSGTGTGFAAVSAERVENGQTSGSVDYDPVLVLPGSTGSTTIDSGLTDTPPLQEDLDGDGSPDIVASTTQPDSDIATSTEPLATTTVDVLKEILCE